MIGGREPEAPSVTPGTGPVSRTGIHMPAGARPAGSGQAAGAEQAADLGAIRRSDAIIDVLASGRRLRPRLLRDPAVAMLASLAADVDAAPCAVPSAVVAGSRARPSGARHARRSAAVSGSWAGSPGARAASGSVSGARHRRGGQPTFGARPHGTAAAAAMAAIATVAAVVTAAGLVIVAMLTRLTGVRNWDRSGTRPPGPGRRY